MGAQAQRGGLGLAGGTYMKRAKKEGEMVTLSRSHLLSLVRGPLRVPVQISVAPDGGLYCLCNDRTVWMRASGYGWTLIEPVPQPEEIDV